jgi:short-subunit dehydrogenase
MPAMTASPRHILITGASSGLGEALAREYARTGLTLSLCGRDTARLNTIAADCRVRGATVHTAALDVIDRAAMAAWVTAQDAALPLDVVIANAGISGGTSGADGDDSKTRHIFAVNVDGVLNTVMPVLPLMRARKHGHVALMSSLASFRGIGGAPAYSASKAAIRIWGEALRSVIAPDNVKVTVICPGFVITPLTDVNTFHMPFLMKADRAARIIRRGLDRQKGRIAFPWPTYAAVLLLQALPDALAYLLTRNTPVKAG